MQSLLIAALVFALLVAVFASQNVEPTQINFLFWGGETSLVVVVIIAATLGALIMGLPGWIKQFRLNIMLRNSKARIKKLEEEVETLQEALSRLRRAEEEDEETQLERLVVEDNNKE